MSRQHLLVFLGPALGLAACAPPARDIVPAAVPTSAYAGQSCAELGKARARLGVKLLFSGLRQDQIAADDNVRTLGVPSMFGTIFEGSEEQKVAELKGELRAVNEEIARAGCLPQ